MEHSSSNNPDREASAAGASEDQKVEEMKHSAEFSGQQAQNGPLPKEEVDSILACAAELEHRSEQETISLAVSELNKTHAIVWQNGKTPAILSENVEGVSFIKPAELQLGYSDWKVPQTRPDGSGKSKTRLVPVAELWLGSPERREYRDGMEFRPLPPNAEDPTDCRPNPAVHNLWKGWGVAPDTEPNPEARCPLFLEVLRDVICGGNNEHATWLWSWLAHMVQRPAEKPRAAVVLKGRKGSGKDSFGDYIARMLLPQNYLDTSRIEDLTGNFTGLIANKLLIKLQEGFWSGDRGADSHIKAFITSSRLTINEKHERPYQIDTCHRLLITSNEARVVNATEGERRYLVLDVSAHKVEDHEFWKAFHAEMSSGGPAALMALLLNWPLDGWNQQPPMTQALEDHIIRGLKGLKRWWWEMLTGEDARPAPLAGWEELQVAVPLKFLHAVYAEWSKKQRYEDNPMAFGIFSRDLRAIAGSTIEVKRQSKGGAKQQQMAHLGTRPECLAAFRSHLGLSPSDEG